MRRSILCDYSDAYILVSATITTTANYSKLLFAAAPAEKI